MTDTEITALAREYAEEEYKTLNLPTDHTEVSAYRYMDFARFLLRRFYLVEKSKVEEEYHEAKFTCGNVDPCSETFAMSLVQKSMMERLFPEIAKEVE